MKILLRVLGTIIGVIAIGACLLGAARNFNDADGAKSLAGDIAEDQKEMEAMQASMDELGIDASELNASMNEINDGIASIPSSGTYTLVAALNGILAVLTIVLIVFLFLSKPKPTVIVAALAVIISVVMIIQAPVVAETWTSTISNKKLAIIAAVPVIVTALLAVLASRMKKQVIAG